MLLHSMSSLKQLYSLAMESHSRYRTQEALETFDPRFNERFILSLADCPSCLVVDDELNVLPISEHNVSSVTPPPAASASPLATPSTSSSSSSSTSLPESSEGNVGDTLCRMCVSADQKEAVRAISDCIAEKSLRQTVALTAGRGRGKSASLGRQPLAECLVSLTLLCSLSCRAVDCGCHRWVLLKHFCYCSAAGKCGYPI